MDRHKADYAAVQRALHRAGEVARQRGASFAAMVRLPPPPSGGRLVLAASVGVDHAGNPDLYSAALAVMMVAAVPSMRDRVRAEISTLRSEDAARKRSAALLAGEGAGDDFVRALTLPAQAVLRRSLDRADVARQAAVPVPACREDVPAEVFNGGPQKSVARLHAELDSALGDAKSVRAELASSMEVRG